MVSNRFQDILPRQYVFHNTFQELSDCASGDRGCRSCRVFRRAFLIRQPSILEEHRLLTDSRPVEATIPRQSTSAVKERGNSFVICARLQNANKYEETASIFCTRSSLLQHPKVEFDPNISTHRVAQEWLEKCDKTHCCREKAWSTENPTRLLRIYNESTVALVETRTLVGPQRYVALSYCWGDHPSIATDAERATIQQSKTIESNINKRHDPFSIHTFPNLLKDAIVFAYRLGIPYIWIDAICIIQGSSDWSTEAPRMHIVYGNATMTLCVLSCYKATESFLSSRGAWRSQSVPCELSRHQILSIDEELHQLKKPTPHSQRAWTLQEDLLSPRKLYWSKQRMYWSCEESNWIEGVLDARKRPCLPGVLEQRCEIEDSRAEGGFLSMCRMGSVENQLNAWIALVTSYTQRNLTDPTDRYSAISGVAKQYLSSQIPDRQLGPNQYLCGLWCHRLPQQLLWKVVTVASQASKSWSVIQNLCPSWTPLSLPFATDITVRHHDTAHVPDFRILTDYFPIPSNDIDQVVADGEKKLRLRICGRMRSFVSEQSECIRWEDVSNTSAPNQPYNILNFLGRDIHFADAKLGRVVTVKGRQQPCIGQLDYQEDVAVFQSNAFHVYCIEVSKDAMLLLKSVEHQDDVFQRIGICINYWNGFFALAERKEIDLV